MTDQLTFRPITANDIPLFHRWRNQPHVSKWWDPPYPSLEDARDEIHAYLRPNFGVDAYIAAHNGRDFAYLQRWEVAQFPDYRPYAKLDDRTNGIDIFIGYVDYLHKGWGTRLMRLFLRDYVFSDPAVPDCVIDPLPDNAAAIRAYEKVGFQHESTFAYKGKRVYLMRVRREAFNPEEA